MAYPRSHLYVTTGGVGWADAEIWQFGLRFDTDTLPTEAQMEVVATAASVFMATANPGFAEHVSLNWVKAAIIGPDGKYPPDSEALLFELDTPVLGVRTNSVLPQVTMAVTLRTPVRRGLAARGRFYVPALGIFADADGQAPTIAAALCTSAKTLLNAYISALDAPLVVASNGKQKDKPERLGAMRTVTAITVGSVYDTQRRRRNRITETYVPEQALTLVGPP